MKALLEQRMRTKARKPEFRRQDSHKKGRLAAAWRKPKGSDSKMRRNIRGYLRSPNVGWGSPNTVKGMTKDGLMPVIVSNQKECEKLDPKKDVAVISAHTGKRKRLGIIKWLSDNKIKILNIKDPQKYIKNVEEALKKAKEEKEKAKKEKEKKKKEKEKAAEEKKKEEEPEEKVEGEEATEEKKKEETKEKEKIITKKE